VADDMNFKNSKMQLTRKAEYARATAKTEISLRRTQIDELK